MKYLMVALLTVSTQAFAYTSTIDTGDLIKKGQYRLSTESNVVFNDINGFNLVGRIDMGFNEDSNFRAIIGTGTVSFQAGLMYKWVPIPDYKNQPALGLLGGFVYARAQDTNFLSLRLHPLISKHFDTNYGDFTPFASLPFGITTAKSTTSIPLQFAFGTDWKPVGLQNLSFLAELGFNLHESYSYISVAALLRFDEEKGIKIE